MRAALCAGTGKLRGEYLLTKQAKIIAMTCTHAALVRKQLVKLGFKFDNIVMEESAQILEVETFIPLMLQARVQPSSHAVPSLRASVVGASPAHARPPSLPPLSYAGL